LADAPNALKVFPTLPSGFCIKPPGSIPTVDSEDPIKTASRKILYGYHALKMVIHHGEAPEDHLKGFT
jgi:hypothetical protein